MIENFASATPLCRLSYKVRDSCPQQGCCIQSLPTYARPALERTRVDLPRLMNQADLRARIRALMASGALPSDPPSIERRGGGDSARFAILNPAPEQRCSICSDLGPQIALFYPAGLVVRLHAACEALWQQERTR